MRQRIVALVIALTACGKNEAPSSSPPSEPAKPPVDAAPDPVKAFLDAHRPLVGTLGKNMRLARGDAHQAPPVTKLEKLAAPLTEEPDLNPNGATRNTMVGTLDQYFNPDGTPESGFGMAPYPDLQQLEEIYSKYTERSNPMLDKEVAAESLERDFRNFDALEYVLIVRVREHMPSKMVGPKIVYGKVAGDAILYDIMTGQRLGAFPFKLTGKAHDGLTIRTDDQAEQLAFELRSNIVAQLDGELAKLVAAK